MEITPLDISKYILADGQPYLGDPSVTVHHQANVAYQTRERWLANLSSIAGKPDAEQFADHIRATTDVRMFFAVNVLAAYQQWMAERAAAQRAADEAAMLASTYDVREWRGRKFAKPTRIPRADAEWAKPGHVLIERGVVVRVPEDDGRDSLSFSANFTIDDSSSPIGEEWPEGTVRAKRMIQRGGRWRVQYLVRPRSASAERRYQAAARIREIESILRHSGDHLTGADVTELRSEVDSLRAQIV